MTAPLIFSAVPGSLYCRPGTLVPGVVLEEFIVQPPGAADEGPRYVFVPSWRASASITVDVRCVVSARVVEPVAKTKAPQPKPTPKPRPLVPATANARLALSVACDVQAHVSGQSEEELLLLML